MKVHLKRQEAPYVLSIVNQDGNEVIIDAAENIGGKGKGMRPMQLLASALASCMSIDVLSILQKKRVNVEVFEIQVEAKRHDGIPARFESFQFVFIVDKQVDLEKLAHAIQLSHEKYCSVSASLRPDITFNYSIETV